ncbi:MAG: SDR family NAD(P)-dependent oxidoreductase [Alphaproteobacteria bacterium]|nr:MAG: SDR family NAD(P)-dependent oxidoreductase [Alphaproteobacteria bacterium]
MKNPKTVLITGASSGIGHALALLYAMPGVTLLLTGRNPDRIAEVARACAAKGAQVKTTVIPVTERETFKREILAWDDSHPIDLVIANAGVSGGSGAAGGESEHQFRAIMEINLDGTLNTVAPLVPRMTARGKGQIALMSSMAGFRGMPNAPGYSVSKMAVRAYGEALRPLLKKSGVEVSVIFPGFVKTPLTDVNRFPMPWLLDAETAAQKIVSGLSANKARIAFPWQMSLLARLIASLPLCLGDFILARAPKKS